MKNALFFLFSLLKTKISNSFGQNVYVILSKHATSLLRIGDVLFIQFQDRKGLGIYLPTTLL